MASFKSAIAIALAAASTVSAHAFFHKAIVGGVDQGQLFGVRAPQSNSPIQDVTTSAIACNSPLFSPVSTGVISVAPGDSFGMQWNHNMAGPTPGDADDPIASSHKGPVMAYMAKVSDASTNDGSGLSWFKVAEEGLDTSTGKWGVDTMIANAGLWSFTMPQLAPGDYLLRGEIIALHSASSTGGAQFYMSCAAIRITGSGTCLPPDTVSFPGAYSASDPGILISIYGNTGQPDNGGKAYTIPGPAIATCDGSSSPSSSVSASSSVAASSSMPSYTNGTSIAWSTKPAGTSSSVSSSVTATPSTGIAVPTSSSSVVKDSMTSSVAPSSSSSASAALSESTRSPSESAPPSSWSYPVEASSTATASSSTVPVSFTSTFTGRIGKPTKFTCYAEE